MMNALRNYRRGLTDSVSLLGYHPKRFSTWVFSISWQRNRPGFRRDFFKIMLEPKARRTGQWHHRIYLFRAGYILIGRQDYHRQDKARA